ncbi:hypothetical protein IB234_16560 [Pseudomonas sp. PDM16]|uniref:hypothetical protein n=1 Tax=Pseudomonas sp. PDM16 TaxID=2769292 RepID=UPI00177BA058|nr:hypothetical protein [Pseudomonas sp. PDM16]MBD9416174.1 hypothetical protein [Pseudomonas sp. PDM16]
MPYRKAACIAKFKFAELGETGKKSKLSPARSSQQKGMGLSVTQQTPPVGQGRADLAVSLRVTAPAAGLDLIDICGERHGKRCGDRSN